jgi:hypothetical protein
MRPRHRKLSRPFPTVPSLRERRPAPALSGTCLSMRPLGSDARPPAEAGAVSQEAGARRPEPWARRPDAEARSQEAGARSQEPGARTQEPGARRPEPGARRPEPGARSPEAGARSQEAGARSQVPGARRPEPGARSPEAGGGRREKGEGRREKGEGSADMPSRLAECRAPGMPEEQAAGRGTASRPVVKRLDHEQNGHNTRHWPAGEPQGRALSAALSGLSPETRARPDERTAAPGPPARHPGPRPGDARNCHADRSPRIKNKAAPPHEIRAVSGQTRR